MMINYEDELNGAQLDAVRYLDGPSLVIAGAGSGKTRVLTYKISYLLEQGYEPWSILALTFTNKAAREMKERIAAQVGDRTASYLWMGTFHSIFSKILRREGHLLGYDSNFTIYDQSDSRSLIKSIIKEMQLEEKVYKPNVVGERISAAKSRLISAAGYARDQGLRGDDQRARIPSTAEIYSRYEARCLQANAMDFDDLLVNTYRLFSEHPQVCEKYVQQFRYVLVDEFQDTNYVQGCIVWQLTQARKAICVVGDDAQSIYSFRGANIGNILGFTERYGDARVFKLEQNYRSTKMIVNAANSLISNNSEQIQKTVFSERGDGEPLKVCSAYSDYEEVEIVANRIAELRRRGLTFKDFAILYRTNAQSRLFEEAFRKRSYPYRIYGGLSFYQRKEIKDTIAYFRLACNLRDEEALKRIINYPSRGIGDTTLLKLRDHSNALGAGMWQVLSQPLVYGFQVNKGTMTKLSAFAQLIDSFVKVAVECDALTAAREIVRASGLWGDIFTGNTVEDRSRQENLQELMNAIGDFVDMRREEGNENNKLIDYINSVQLLTDQDVEGEASDDFITLMTVHSAKGLEFPAVFVVGLEEELFPNAMAQNSIRELEEERRLFYVAITRAMDYCMLTFAKMRYKFGTSEFAEPSRFLKEIDRRYISFAGGSTPMGQQRSSYSSGYGGSGLFASTNMRRGDRRSDYSLEQEPQQRPTYTQQSQRPTYNSAPRSSEPSYNNSYRQPAHLQRLSDAVRDNTSSGSANVALSVGTVVSHDRFGVGQVLSLEGSGDNAKAKIRFKNAGEKILLLKFAKLKVVQ